MVCLKPVCVDDQARAGSQNFLATTSDDDPDDWNGAGTEERRCNSWSEKVTS